MGDIPDEDEGEIERDKNQRLLRVHKNLGHPSNRLFAQILKEAKAPDQIVELASKLHCPICARHVQISPARPANPFRARELGQVVAMDFSFHTLPDRQEVMMLHFVDVPRNKNLHVDETLSFEDF